MKLPKIEPVNSKKRQYRLLENYHYFLKNGDSIVINRGFLFDGASIPGLFWGFPLFMTPANPQIIAGALVHDAIYVAKGKTTHKACMFRYYPKSSTNHGKKEFTRIEADQIFDEINERSGMPWIKRTICFRGVRLGGWVYWNN